MPHVPVEVGLCNAASFMCGSGCRHRFEGQRMSIPQLISVKQLLLGRECRCQAIDLNPLGRCKLPAENGCMSEMIENWYVCVSLSSGGF